MRTEVGKVFCCVDYFSFSAEFPTPDTYTSTRRIALLSTKVTKHIPPQPSPGGLALAGIYFGTVVCADQIGEINDEQCDLTESRLEEENDEQEIFAGAVNG